MLYSELKDWYMNTEVPNRGGNLFIYYYNFKASLNYHFRYIDDNINNLKQDREMLDLHKKSIILIKEVLESKHTIFNVSVDIYQKWVKKNGNLREKFNSEKVNERTDNIQEQQTD